MGQLSDILTQNDLLALNDALQQLAANLKIHVGENMSVAHGINAIVADYYDNAGDKWGNIVVVFEFGEPPDVVRMYVPAQVSTLAGATGNDTGVLPTSANPAGSFLSPGVPLTLRPLVTELTSEAVTQAEIYNNLLLAHAAKVHSGTGVDQVHGGRSYTLGSIPDSLDHSMGRYYITLGINGTGWKIPADPLEQGGNYGPPQRPRFVTVGPTVITATFAAPIHGTFALYSNYYLEQHVSAGDSWPSLLTLQADIVGTSPVDYEWQWATSASGPWSAYTIGVSKPPINGCGWVGSTNVSGSLVTPGTLSSQFTLDAPGGDKSGTWYTRLKLDNSGVGGDVVYSPTITVHMKDESGSWLCTVACKLGYVTYDEYRADLRYTSRHVPRVYREGYALWAFPTSKFLLNHTWPRPFIMPFVRAWTWHMAFKDGTRKEDSRLGTVVYNVVKPICGLVGLGWRGYCALRKMITGKNPPPFSRPTLRISRHSLSVELPPEHKQPSP